MGAVDCDRLWGRMAFLADSLLHRDNPYQPPDGGGVPGTNAGIPVVVGFISACYSCRNTSPKRKRGRNNSLPRWRFGSPATRNKDGSCGHFSCRTGRMIILPYGVLRRVLRPI